MVLENLKKALENSKPAEEEIEETIDDEYEYDVGLEIATMREEITALNSNLEKYVTSRENQKSFMESIEKRDAEMANKKLMSVLEAVTTMREDFFKLCEGINNNIDKMDVKTVMKSFEAYGVDMENILNDVGMEVGSFNLESLSPLHHRIVGVISTEEESKNNLIAKSLSDGYKFNGRVIYKERVDVYKYTENKTEE